MIMTTTSMVPAEREQQEAGSAKVGRAKIGAESGFRRNLVKKNEFFYLLFSDEINSKNNGIY
jgi:hypothetical protein